MTEVGLIISLYLNKVSCFLSEDYDHLLVFACQK